MEGSPERKRSDGVLNFIVSAAAAEVGLTAVRADKIAEPGQITLQVIAHVLGAKAAVVDLSGLNPNVFYEMAIRHTARLPVALIADKGCALPFDIAQMRTIFFDHTDLESANECKKAIASQLKEALSGAVDSPIATTVDVGALQSGSVVERNVADLVTTVGEMAKDQRATLDRMERLQFMLRGTEVLNPKAITDLAVGLERLQTAAFEFGASEVLEAIAELEPPMRYFRDRLDRSESHWVNSRELTMGSRRIPEDLEVKSASQSRLGSRGSPRNPRV